MVCGRLRAVMIASSLLLAAANTPTGGDRATDADPVDLFTGLNIRERDDIVVPGEPKIELHRAFGSRWSRSRAFGIGTSHSYDVFLAAESEKAKEEKKQVDLIRADGGRARFIRTSPGTGRDGAVLMHTGSPGELHGSRLSWNGAAWDLDLPNGSRFTFPRCDGKVARPEQCALKGYRDPQGRSLTFDRDANGNLLRVSAGWFRRVNFRYDSANRIITADTGWALSMTTVDYAYDEGGRLASVKSRQLSAWTVLFELISAYQTTRLPSPERMTVRWNAEYTYDEHIVFAGSRRRASSSTTNTTPEGV